MQMQRETAEVRFLVVLFAANVAMSIWVWVDMRHISQAPEYVINEYAAEVDLIAQPASRKARCLLLGPIEDKKNADLLQDVFKQARIPFHRVEQHLEKAPNYWVYFGPLPDYDAALAQLREFQSKNIDSFIIKRDDLFGAISVGVFENIDSARRMQTRMFAKGYPTSIRNIFKFQTVWWYEIPRTESLVNSLKNKEIDGYGRVHFDFREIFCKTVAS